MPPRTRHWQPWDTVPKAKNLQLCAFTLPFTSLHVFSVMAGIFGGGAGPGAGPGATARPRSRRPSCGTESWKSGPGFQSCGAGLGAHCGGASGFRNDAA